MSNKVLHSLAEDIEAEFGDLRRPHLQQLFNDAQLAALELALESALVGLSRADRTAMKGRALDDLIRRLNDSDRVKSQDRFGTARSIVEEHTAAIQSETHPATQPLAAWLSKEEQILERVAAGHGAGELQPEHIAGKTNVEIMREMMEGRVHYPTIAKTLSFCIVEVDQGRAVLQCAPSRDFVNPMHTVHGGWISTLLDTVMGTAVFSALPPEHTYTTTSLSMHFLASLTLKTDRVRALGTLLHPIGRKTLVKSWLYGPDEKVYAEGQGEYRTFPFPA